MIKCAICGVPKCRELQELQFITVNSETGDYVCADCYAEAAHEYQLWLLAKLQKEIAERKAKKDRAIAEIIVKGMKLDDCI